MPVLFPSCVWKVTCSPAALEFKYLSNLTSSLILGPVKSAIFNINIRGSFLVYFLRWPEVSMNPFFDILQEDNVRCEWWSPLLYLPAACVSTLGVGEKLFTHSMYGSHHRFQWLAVCGLLVTFQLTCRRNSKEAVSSGVVDQRAREQEPREEPAEGVAFLLKEH